MVDSIIRERYALMAPQLLKELQKRGFESFFCTTAAEAADLAISMIPEKSSVSWGGSMSWEQAGIFPRLRNGDYRLIDRDSASDPAERKELMRQAFFCHTYLSSVNGMSENGIMVNIDGNCNRIAAIAYGPEQVILLVGMNKVCRDLASARDRARHVAAPANSVRLHTNTPCARTGFCCECSSPESICAQIVEMHRNRIPGRIKVILCGEDLGL